MGLYRLMVQLSRKDIEFVLARALEASEIIMMHYDNTEVKASRKRDNSPVTEADLASNQHITAALKQLYPDIPVVSEEGDEAENLKLIKQAPVYWLIDPLDGTWSFIKRRGYFVINIALMVNGIPSWGLIESPLTNETFYLNEEYKCYYRNEKNAHMQLAYTKDYTAGYDFVVSHQNLDQTSEDFIRRYKIKTITPIASALKFGLLVNGIGDIYPRFQRTCIWDTAAGHALLLANGGEILDLNGKQLVYTESLLNPNFVAVAVRDMYIGTEGVK